MFKSIISALTLATITTTSALATMTRVSDGVYVAEDANDRLHLIEYVRQDHEGDVQVKVTVNGAVVYYWVNCREDRISRGGELFDGWEYVDHRKMVGYYSDVACGRR